MPQQNNYSESWRQKEQMLSPGVVNEFVVDINTKANHAIINNLGAANLYVSTTGTPSSTKYDVMVPPFGKQLIAQQNMISRILIFNSGSNPNDSTITTFAADFNPATLLGTGVGTSTSSGGSGGSGGNGQTVISGFSVSLPAGNNHIGTVTIDSMPTQTIQMSSLPAGTNNIGHVNVDTLPPLPAGSSNIGHVNVDNALTIGTMPEVQISSMPPVQVSSNPVASEHQFYEGAVGTTEVIYTFNATVTNFSFISNDDTTNDLYITFDGVTATTTPGAGQNSVIHLGPGESINDFGRQCSSIHFIRKVAGGNVRVLGA